MEPNGSFTAHKNPPLVYTSTRILSQMKPVHILISHFKIQYILILSSQLYLGHLSDVLASTRFTRTLYILLFVLMHSTCLGHLIILQLIILAICGDEHKLRSSALCNFLHPPISSYPLGLYNLISSLTSNTLSLCSSLNVRDQVSHPYKTTGKLQYRII
jgi:hypothetical protein